MEKGSNKNPSNSDHRSLRSTIAQSQDKSSNSNSKGNSSTSSDSSSTSSSASLSISSSVSSSPPRYSENVPRDNDDGKLDVENLCNGSRKSALPVNRQRYMFNASKMEKQRQNEEIATTSQVAIANAGVVAIALTDTDITAVVTHANEMNPTARSACFIDASSLLDEDELLPINGLEKHKIPNAFQQQMNTIRLATPTNTIEFAQQQQQQSNSSSSCTSEPDNGLAIMRDETTPITETAVATSNSSNINNLSDEEKLWKRHQNVTNNGSNSKQMAIIAGNSANALGNDDDTEASVSLAAYASDISDRSENNILIKKQNKQKPIAYTTLPLSMSPKFSTFNTQASISSSNYMQTLGQNSGENDLCYTTDYSSSSPAPSLVWSKQEKRPFSTSSGAGVGVGNYANEFHLMPDTPHNSIVHIEQHNNVSNTSSMHPDYSTLSSSLSQQRDSGAFCCDATDSPISLPSTPKTPFKGGSTERQHTPSNTSQQPHNNDPGDIDDEDDDDDDEEVNKVELRVKSRSRKVAPAPLTLSSSWVVDMSDCRSSNCSSECSLPPPPSALQQQVRERCDSSSSSKSNRSCGFYVPLTAKPDKCENAEIATIPTANLNKSYAGTAKAKSFFVNLTQSDTQVI